MSPSTSLTSCSCTVIWSLFIHEISLLVFQQCQKSIKQASKESQQQHSLLPSTQIMVCQRLLSVIHQLSVSAGLAHACWSINFYVDLSNKQSVRHQSMNRTLSTNFKHSVRITAVRQADCYLGMFSFIWLALCFKMWSNMGALIWLFLVPSLLKTTALLISQCTLQKVSAFNQGKRQIYELYFRMFTDIRNI